MRKMLFTVFIALCVTFPGEVCANQSTICKGTPKISLETESVNASKIDPTKLDQVFKFVAMNSPFSLEKVSKLYQKGKITIRKESNTMVVRFTDGSGPIIVISEEF